MHHHNTGETPGSTTEHGTFIIVVEASQLTNFEYQDMWLEIDGITFKVNAIKQIPEHIWCEYHFTYHTDLYFRSPCVLNPVSRETEGS